METRWHWLHDRVCDGTYTLQRAQEAIVMDWYAVYLQIHRRYLRTTKHR